jgi:hypothetical protein
MGAAMDKYRVTLDADERVALEQLVNVGKGAARKLIHARVLLLADTSQGDERPDTDIVCSLGSACGRSNGCGNASPFPSRSTASPASSDSAQKTRQARLNWQSCLSRFFADVIPLSTSSACT